MSTAEVKVIIDRIYDEEHCQTLSFTGGEPTLREDLPELVAYAQGKGLRVNLITNGFRCADPDYVQSLADAGLDSAQLSLEGGSAAVHDAITRHPGSWERAVQGVRNLRAAKVHTHTNTTVCGGNRAHLLELVDFIAEDSPVLFDWSSAPARPGRRRGRRALLVSATVSGQYSNRANSAGRCVVLASALLPSPVRPGSVQSCACVAG